MVQPIRTTLVVEYLYLQIYMKNLQALILLFIANSISAVAQGISMIAIPWYFAELEQMDVFASVYIAVTLIAVFWSPYCGTLIDRYNRKYIFMILALVMGCLLLLISGWGFYQNHLAWYWVGVVFILTFLNYNIHFPAVYAFAQEIVEPSFYGKLSSYLEIQHQLTTIFAGAIAAMLLEGATDGVVNLFGFKVATNWMIAPWEIYEIFLIDACTYFIAFGIIALIVYEPILKRKKESGTVLDQFKIGWAYLKQHKGITIFGIASFSVFACLVCSTFYLMPIYVKNHLQEQGDVFAAGDMYYAIGAVFSGIVIRKVFKNSNLTHSVIVLTLVAAAVFFMLAVSRHLAIFYGMFFLLGVTNAGVRIQRITYLLNHVPNHVYGRANSIFFLSHIFFRVLFLLSFSLPFFLTSNNIIFAFVIFTLFLIASAIVLYLFKGSFEQ